MLKQHQLIKGEIYKYIYSSDYVIGKCSQNGTYHAQAIRPRTEDYWGGGSFHACNGCELAS